MLLLGQHQMYQHSNHKGAGNLFEKVMKENFPNLVKEIDMQVQEAQSPKQDEPKKTHTSTHHSQNAKGERQRENLKSRKRKAVSYLQGKSHKTVS